MPFTIVWPQGIDQALFGVFVLIGGLGAGAALAARQFPLVVATAVHAFAGALSVLAGDLITLLVAWELLTFSAFAIIRRGETAAGKESARAAFWYLAAQISAAALFFVAIVAHFGESGSLTVGPLASAAQPFMLIAVLIKTAMMPLHGWLVGSYTKAGLLGSFVLSAFATKVGVYTAARTVVAPLGSVPVLSMIGAVVAVVAVLFALTQHSARRLLSYHIVSQVGYMLVGVGLAGAGAAAAVGVTAGLFHAVNHIIYKALLFLVVAVVAARFGHDDLRRMGGLARSMPLVFVCGVIGALAITGLPLTSGYASKVLLKKAGGELQIVLLTLASIGTGLSFTKFIYLIFLRPVQGEPSRPGPSSSPAVSFALIVLASLSVAIGVAPGIVAGVPALDFYSSSAVVAGTWPAGAALVLWFLVRRRLVTVGQPDDPDPALRRVLLIVSRPLLVRLRGAHRVDAQLGVGIAVAAAVVLTVLLVVL